MSEALKPCPFCGGEPVLEGGAHLSAARYVFCTSCGVTTAYLRNENEAREAWNKRTGLLA